MVENTWRDENCPGYGYLYCENIYEPCEDTDTCEGAWNCDDIEMITLEFVAYYSTNGDNFVDLNDEIDSEHFELLMNSCDYN